MSPDPFCFLLLQIKQSAPISPMTVPNQVMAIILIETASLALGQDNSTGAKADAEAKVASPQLFDTNPQHIWNRTHAALWAKPPGEATQDRIDAMFDRLSIREGKAHDELKAILDEFNQAREVSENMPPLQHAVMQRDLLAGFFSAIAGSEIPEDQPLRKAWAQAIQMVALTRDQILQLPDTYAAASAAPNAISTYDPAHPAAYLPKDLLADNGPWLALRSKEGARTPIARMHFHALMGLSAFEVRMRHPEGRKAGIAYLKDLEDMKNPGYNEALTPQFPAGTQWALLRRAILADDQGRPVVSPIVESVQVRIFRDITPGGYGEIEEKQFSFEWEMPPTQLLSKFAFRSTTAADLPNSFFLQQTGVIVSPDAGSLTIHCAVCHAASGIHAINSRELPFGSNKPNQPPVFVPTTNAEIAADAMSQASALPTWIILQRLYPSFQSK